MHLSFDNLFDLLKLTRVLETDSDITKILEGSNCRCDVCLRFNREPVCFSVSLPSEFKFVFEDELSVNIMFLDGNVVPYTVGTTTRFFATTLLDMQSVMFEQSVEEIWLTFVITGL